MNNAQAGPSCAPLPDVVAALSYKPGWTFALRDMPRGTEHHAGSEGLTLCIAATVPDSRDPDGTTRVEHWMAVPCCQYDRQTWERWVLDCVLLVERHEAMEYFRVDGVAPYWPAHGVGRNPYTIERTCSRSQDCGQY